MGKTNPLSGLPSHLQYLVAPAMKYGRYQFDDDVDQFLETASPDMMVELEQLAERVRFNGHYKEVNTWLDGHEKEDEEGAARLYFLFGVLDAADLEFE